MHNSYNNNFKNHCIKKFLNKLFIQRDLTFMVPRRELICILSYLGKTSLDLRTRLRWTIEGNLPYCKLKVIFRSKCRLNTYFVQRFTLEKRFTLELFITITVVTARLLIMKKPATFKPEQLNKWESLILQENDFKKLSSVIWQKTSSDFDIIAADSNKFKWPPRDSLLFW